MLFFLPIFATIICTVALIVNWGSPIWMIILSMCIASNLAVLIKNIKE